VRANDEQFWIGIYILQREGGPGRISGGSGKQGVVKEKNLPLTILKGVDTSEAEAGGGHGLAGANGAVVDDAGCHGGLLRDEPLDLGRLIGFKYERARFDIGEEPLLCHAVTKDVIMNVAFGEELAQERNVFALVGIGETFIGFVEGLRDRWLGRGFVRGADGEEAKGEEEWYWFHMSVGSENPKKGPQNSHRREFWADIAAVLS
jgi:hypothetical protein